MTKKMNLKNIPVGTLLKSTITISLEEKNTYSRFFRSRGFRDKIDFEFNKGLLDDEIILTLKRGMSDLIEKGEDGKSYIVGEEVRLYEGKTIFEVFDEVREYSFLIRFAEQRTQGTFDVYETYIGTIKDCESYLRKNYNLEKYAIKLISYGGNKHLALN